MQVEILLAALVLAVAALVAVDLLRRTSDAPHEHAARPGHEAGREISPPSRAGTAVFPHLAARGGRGAPDSGAGPARARKGSPGVQKNWQVGTRLCLLAAISAIAAALAAVGAVRAVGAFQGASFHSDVSSVHDGAVASGLVAFLFTAVVLALGLWSTRILIRSVLRPLRTLHAGALDLAEVRLPAALRHIGQAGGAGQALEVKTIGVSSPDEIGEVARAFDQVQKEVVRLAVNEAGRHERLDEMFVDLAHRGQALVERQARLIDDLEYGERDSGRLASLLKMGHIATRMRRQAQNLLVLAGHDVPGRWNQPVTLADVIRAAISEIEEGDRVSFSAQPGIAVAGPAVNDVVHLIAELAENATSLSAADTPVDISGRTLASGGVLVEITDQGVGMSQDQMAQANWQLDHPSPADLAAWRSMGFLVVGRLAALHGARVRLQPAESGGLAALVWLPDAIIVVPDSTLVSGPAGIDGFRSRPGAHEAAPALSPAPVMADLDMPPVQRRIPAPVPDAGQRPAGQRPGPAAPPARPRLLSRPRPPAPELAGGTSGAQASPREASPFGLSPAEARRAPAAEDPEPERRLPIYEAVESDWFRNHGKTLGSTAAAEGGWASPADPGWHAAQAVTAPSSGGTTTVGLPVRVPRANLIPGAVGGQQAAAPVSARSADAARDRLAGFQRGISQGRAALDPRRADEA